MSWRMVAGTAIWCLRMVLLIGGALAISLVLEPLIEPDFSPLFLCAIALGTWRWGVRAGILGTLLSGVALIFLFLPPHYTLTVPSWPVFFRELSFFGTAALIMWLVRRFALAERGLSSSLEEIRAREERFRVALLKSQIVVFHQDLNLRYLWVYNPFPEHQGAPLEGTSDLELFPPGESGQLVRLKQRVLSSGVGAREEVALTAGGKVRSFELTLEPFRNSSGQMAGLLGTAVDVTDRKLSEERLRDSQGRLRSLAAHLQTAQEAERTLTSQDIHNQVSQMLAAVTIELSGMANLLPEGASASSMKQRISNISEIVAATIESSERISGELRPSLLDNLGLVAAIESQARAFQSRTGIRTTISSLEDIRLPGEAATAVFRIYEQALTNVARRAQAREVHISLSQVGQYLLLQVRDDAQEPVKDDILESESLRLLAMHERARGIGGRISVENVPGEGTMFCLGIPIDGQRSEATKARAACAVIPSAVARSDGGVVLCPMDGSHCRHTSII
jgi:PAS domain S-box-containing protein